MPSLRFGDRKIDLPGSRVARIAIGAFLVLLGAFGFLPVLGFWMVPAGLVVLSVDIPMVRRWRRRSTVALVLRWERLQHWLHGRFGITIPGAPHLPHRRKRKGKRLGNDLRGAG